MWAASSVLASLALGLAIFCMSRSVRRFERRALETLNEWFERAQAPGAAASFVERSGQAYAMRSMLEYRLGRREAALQSANTAIERAPEPVEDLYTLRLAIQLELGDRAGAIETLETLNSRWPSPERAQQLAALRADEQ